MDRDVLSNFYRFNGIKNEFCKIQFIRLIRNKIIDPNTNYLLSKGFEFYDEKEQVAVIIPCDDCNWNEYLTFYEGLKFGILTFPFTIKLYHDYFYNIDNKIEFDDLYKKIIQFRTDIIKEGWAIKYGTFYKDQEYPSLEDLSEKDLINWKDPRKNVKMNLDMLTKEDFDRR